MVDWNSPEEIARDAAAFTKFMHALLGLYIWEFATSLDFDWQFFSGKKTFRWPLIFYFAGRYTLLFALIGIAIALNVTSEINCQALYTFNQLFGNASIGLASINLSLRTMAVWSQQWYIVLPLVAIIMGQWSLLLHGVLLTAKWIPAEGCVIIATDSHILAISFIYTMVFDFVVLCLTGWKLMSPANSRSRLVALIFGDGLIFFFIAFLSNLLATIFMLLNLNGIMSIIANVPAAIASTIVACRAVRRLTNYTFTGPEVFASTTQASTLAFHSQGNRAANSMMKGAALDGVHVQMDTFASPSDHSFPHFDAAGNVIPKRAAEDEEKTLRTGTEHSKSYDGTYDAEAQVIRADFKRPPY